MSQLSTRGVSQVYCRIEGATVTSLYDGSTQEQSALNCSFVKSVFNRTDIDVYWIDGQQTLCDLDHPEGIPLGGAGTSAATASVSCETLRQVRSSLDQSLTSAVYYITLSGTATQVYCKLDLTPAINLGADGSTKTLAAASCALARTHFANTGGIVWVDPDGDASDTSNARQRQCVNGV
eukprot:m.168824 g.168824  ORF g.168824 m.168824 type:complete len:179 (+) comp16657_c0_seq4:864-1400(+)